MGFTPVGKLSSPYNKEIPLMQGPGCECGIAFPQEALHYAIYSCSECGRAYELVLAGEYAAFERCTMYDTETRKDITARAELERLKNDINACEFKYDGNKIKEIVTVLLECASGQTTESIDGILADRMATAVMALRHPNLPVIAGTVAETGLLTERGVHCWPLVSIKNQLERECVFPTFFTAGAVLSILKWLEAFIQDSTTARNAVKILREEKEQLHSALIRIKNGEYDNAHSPKGAAAVASEAVKVKMQPKIRPLQESYQPQGDASGEVIPPEGGSGAMTDEEINKQFIAALMKNPSPVSKECLDAMGEHAHKFIENYRRICRLGLVGIMQGKMEEDDGQG